MLDRAAPGYNGVDKEIKKMAEYSAYLREETEAGFIREARRRKGELDEMNTSLRSTMNSALAQRDTNINNVNSRVTTVNNSLTSVTNRVGTAESTIESMQETIAQIQRTLQMFGGGGFGGM